MLVQPAIFQEKQDWLFILPVALLDAFIIIWIFKSLSVIIKKLQVPAIIPIFLLTHDSN